MPHIKKGDLVYIRKGKDRGKSGKILRLLPRENRCIVEGINFVKRHERARSNEMQGGIIQKEAPMQISNLSLFCPRCNRGVRVGIGLNRGVRSRYCKRCREQI